MRKLIALGVIVLLLIVHTVVTDRETKEAEPGGGGKVVELEGGDLYYKEAGERDDPTIVLLHGFACSQRWWDRVAPELSRRGLHVIRFDLLGHGRSEMPRDGYGMDEQAELVAAALRKLRVRRATVVGHSMGGTVASALVEQEPRLVRKVAVIGTPPRDGFVDESLLRQSSTWPVVGELARRFAPDAMIQRGARFGLRGRRRRPGRVRGRPRRHDVQRLRQVWKRVARLPGGAVELGSDQGGAGAAARHLRHQGRDRRPGVGRCVGEGRPARHAS